jgi:hypothetical protein
VYKVLLYNAIQGGLVKYLMVWGSIKCDIF